MMLSTGFCVPLLCPGQCWPGLQELLAGPARIRPAVLVRQFRGCDGEAVRAIGLAGCPMEEHLGGDRFEAGVLGPEPVRGGVAFDAGAVAGQSPFPSRVRATANMM